ncbi:ABC transporter B family member 27 [Lingula anatina]|uniref:ABC transporter B family member 27 n=1 Tax=Lingula anatina TaxID=7574 RepID=A0A1S3KH33_LINAN|nr:ABC transporter B family member 27 [Lingula anatina]|eukprot:XP_013421774.1 ABC transporter B family member 27 [Lingula anatina]
MDGETYATYTSSRRPTGLDLFASSASMVTGALSGGYSYYTLPGFRFLNVVRIVFLVDIILGLTLWLVDLSTASFIDAFTSYSITTSFQDLGLMTFLRGVLLFMFFTSMEDYYMQILDDELNDALHRKRYAMHTFVFIISIVCLGFGVVKGVLVLLVYLQVPTSLTDVSPTSFALLISFVVFSVLEFLFACTSFCFMRRLADMRRPRNFDSTGLELGEDGTPIRTKGDLRRLLGLAVPDIHLLIIGVLSLFVVSGAMLGAPLMFGKVVNAASEPLIPSQPDPLLTVIFTLLGLYIASALGTMVRGWCFNLLGVRIVCKLRKDLFANIIRQEIGFFDENKTGDLANRLATDTQVVQDVITRGVREMTNNFIQIVGSLVFLIVINALAVGVMLTIVPVVVICFIVFGKVMKKMRQQFQADLAAAASQADEAISGMKTVRTFNSEAKLEHAYSTTVDKSYGIGRTLSFVSGCFEGLISFLLYGSITLMMWFCGSMVRDGKLKEGDLTSFLLYTLTIAVYFVLMTSVFGDLMQGVGASIKVFELLDRRPEISNTGGKQLPELQGVVEFKHVQFHYPSRPDTKILKGVSFTAQPGEMVAFVGPSGSGKSTIISLIERFYLPTRGKICLDGSNLRHLDPQWFRKKIVLVGQEPTLFAGTIAENIAWACEDATMADIIAASKQANSHEFIERLENGYETMVGERGASLSGGQKQRIAIARAFILNPLILLLDEATSALDAESEHLVQEAIDRAMKGRTVLVVAHRLSTVRNAHQIVVLDQGRVVEKGNHDELLAMEGVYKKLVIRQLASAEQNSSSIGNGVINAESESDSD